MRAGDICIDLVTRQPLYVVDVVASSLVEYFEDEGFDLYSYGAHPYLPVRLDNMVYECAYLSDLTVDSLTKFSDAKLYDFPQGRLARAPVELAGGDGDDD